VSNLKDQIKSKMKESAHTQLIDPIELAYTKEDTNVNNNVNVNIKPPKRRVKFEDRYTRQTYYIQNELVAKINQIAENEKGEKTRIINEALRAYLGMSID
jgi:hypothetical protein